LIVVVKVIATHHPVFGSQGWIVIVIVILAHVILAWELMNFMLPQLCPGKCDYGHWILCAKYVNSQAFGS
jgi:hypothetical protein